MTSSRRHGWTKGPTKLLLDAIRYKVCYRARKLPDSDGKWGEWQESEIIMVVKPTQEDPLATKALDKRLRFATAKHAIELHVISIVDMGDEAPLQGTAEGVAKVVDSETYEGAKRASELVYPGHPLWDKSKLVN